MGNRFRMAVKNTGEEILSAGKQEEISIDDILDSEALEVKEIDSELQDISQKEVSIKEYSIINENLKADSDFNRLSSFLKEKVNDNIYELRLNKLKEILVELINQGKTKQPLLLIDTKSNIELWVEVIKYSIPERLKALLTFNIYDNETMVDCKNCVVFNNKKAWGESMNYPNGGLDYNVFNFTKVSNNISSCISKYSEFIQVGYELKDRSFQEFKAFFDKFKYSSLDTNIEKCLMLFYFTSDGSRYLENTHIVEAFEFLNLYGNEDISRMLFEKIDLNSNMDKDMVLIISKFALKISKQSKIKEYYSKTYSFIFEYMQKLLKESNSNDLTNVYEFYNVIKSIEENNIENFIKYGLNSCKLSEYINNKDTKFATFYLTIVTESLLGKGSKWNEDNVYIDFIEKGIDVLTNEFQVIKKIFNNLSENIECMASLILMYYKKVEADETKKYQILQFCSEQENVNNLLRIIIENPDGGKLVFDEFKHKLGTSLNRVQLFWAYKAEFFDNNLKFSNDYFSLTFEFYLKCIKEHSTYEEEWAKILKLLSNNEIEIDQQILTNCINDHENFIPLNGPNIITQLNMKEILRIKKSKNIITTNTNSSLIQFGNNIKIAKSDEQITKLINEEFPNISMINERKIDEFFEWCLDLLVNNDNVHISNLITFYEKATETSEIRERIFSKDNFKHLINNINTFNVTKIQFYLLITYNYLIKSHKVWNDKDEYEEFIKVCITALNENKNVLKYCLEAIVEHKNYFAEMLSICTTSNVSNDVAVSFFMDKTQKNGKKWSNEVKASVNKCTNGTKFLFEDFKRNIELSSNKSQFFWEYIAETVDNLQEYKTNKLVELCEVYMYYLENINNNSLECLNTLNYLMDNNIYVNKKIATTIITQFEKSITFVSPKEELKKVIDKIIIYKSQCHVITIPDITNIIKFSFSLEKVNSSEEMLKLIKNSNLNLKEIHKAKYLEYIQWVLSLAANKVDLIKHSEEIRKVLCVEEFKKDYENIYTDLAIKVIDSGSVNLSDQQLQILISNPRNSFDVVSGLIIKCFNKGLLANDISIYGKIFSEIVDNSLNYDLSSLEIREHFSKLDKGNQLLFEEYKYRLDSSENKTMLYQRYVMQVCDQLEDYKKEYYSKVIEKYHESIKTSAFYYDDCYKLIKSIRNQNVTLDNDILIEIITSCEKIMRIAEPTFKENDVFEDINAIKLSRKIVTKPDITKIVSFGISLKSLKNNDQIRQLISNTTLNLSDIDFARYEALVDWCLPKMLSAANTWQVHASIRKILCSENLKGIFYTMYIGILSDQLGGNDNSWIEISSQFLIFFINTRDYLGDEIYIQGRANIINALSRCNKAKIDEIDKLITRSYDMENKEALSKEWETIKKRVTPSKHEKGFLSKVFNNGN